MSISHDQNFKNLIIDYPLQALQFFTVAEAPQTEDVIEITPIRQELQKDRLSDRFFELEPDPERQAKYLALLDKALPLTDNERQQYERDFPQEQQIMGTLTERWKAEGREDGIRQGLQEGIQQGRQEGLAQGAQEGRRQVLARQLEKRFGHLDASTVERLQGAASPELDQWAERILDAERLEDVFLH